jgi:hypothetical protein
VLLQCYKTPPYPYTSALASPVPQDVIHRNLRQVLAVPSGHEVWAKGAAAAAKKFGRERGRVGGGGTGDDKDN